MLSIVALTAVSYLARQLAVPAAVPSRQVGPRYRPRALAVDGRAEAELRLVRMVTKGGSMAAVQSEFVSLETTAPAPPDLLWSEAGTKLIDGRWELLSTIAANVGSDELSKGVGNAVNASGLVLDASAERAPVQEVSVATGRVANEIQFPLPFDKKVVFRVAGQFAADSSDGRRANIEFDTLDCFVVSGRAVRRVLRAGWLFSIVRSLRPALINGAEDEGSWLETTYISDRVRLGRGNKGSIFILQRCEDDSAGMLSDWPL